MLTPVFFFYNFNYNVNSQSCRPDQKLRTNPTIAFRPLPFLAGLIIIFAIRIKVFHVQGLVVERPVSVEMSVWGAASLAGLQVELGILPKVKTQNGWQNDGRRIGAVKDSRRMANGYSRRTDLMIYPFDILLLSVLISWNLCDLPVVPW